MENFKRGLVWILLETKVLDLKEGYTGFGLFVIGYVSCEAWRMGWNVRDWWLWDGEGYCYCLGVREKDFNWGGGSVVRELEMDSGCG